VKIAGTAAGIASGVALGWLFGKVIFPKKETVSHGPMLKVFRESVLATSGQVLNHLKSQEYQNFQGRFQIALAEESKLRKAQGLPPPTSMEMQKIVPPAIERPFETRTPNDSTVIDSLAEKKGLLPLKTKEQYDAFYLVVLKALAQGESVLCPSVRDLRSLEEFVSLIEN
jgi:hypothetical protein